MMLCKVIAVVFCMQLLARGASAQAAAYAAAGDVSALAAAGAGSALAAAGSTSAGYNPVYVQPIVTAFTSSKAWDAANAIATALNNNQAASVLQAVAQVDTSESACKVKLTPSSRRLNVFNCCRPKRQTCSQWWYVTATTTL